MNKTLVLALALFVCSVSAYADAFSFSSVFISSPGFASGSGDALLGSLSSGFYLVNGAEFCLDASCQSGPVGSTMRLTNLSVTCLGEGDCTNPLDFQFTANGAVSNPTGPVLVSVNLNGFGTAGGFFRVCIQDNSDVCNSDGTGNQFFGGDFSGAPSSTGSTVFLSDGNFSIVGEFEINSLTSNGTVQLNNSLDISLSPAVPEPATIALFGLGLASVAVLRRRKRS